ncbi:MAG: polyketide cyclase [Bacteroidetes bacterium]|nr:MAG: polyketide cyclase [Bacteroidota bacterium]
MLKKILIGLVAILVIALIATKFMTKEFGYEDSVQIDATPEQVWQHTSSLRGMGEWSPWMAKDENIEQTWEGEDGAIGSKNCWTSEVETVGVGCQSITESEANKHLGTSLKFEKPNDGLGNAYVDLEESDGGTKVTWGFTSEMPWPMNLMIPMMNMKEAMGADWTNGLNKLKELSEASAKADLETAAAAAQAALEAEAAALEESTTEEEE